MRRSLLSAGVAIALAGAGTAWAAGTVSASLTPDQAGHASVLHISAQGPFPTQSRLPSSVAGLFAKGFLVDPHSTSAKCRAQSSSATCPPGSQIGTGQATFHVTTSVGVGSGDYTLDFKLFLGPPSQSGDIASVVMQGTLNGRQFSTTGRLFKISQGPYGLELKTSVPSEQPPSGVSVNATLESLRLTAGASRRAVVKRHGRKHKRVYSLITNPKQCSPGGWPGELVETFSDGTTQSMSFAAPCQAR